MTLSLELEIKTLLEEFRNPEVVGEKLIQLFEDHSQEWSAESLKDLARFLLRAGLHQALIRFCLKNFTQKNFVMPWSYFIEALGLGLEPLDEDLIKLVQKGLDEEQAASQACLAEEAEKVLPNASILKNELRFQRRKNATEMKRQMFSELLTLRTQQLYEQEKIMLERMQRMFPKDQEVLEEIRQHKERYALEILSRRSSLFSRSPSIHVSPPSPETVAALDVLRNALIVAAEGHPDLAFDFAVAAYMLEEPQTSLTILEKRDLSLQERWFYLEVKLKCRHFLEVLNELSQMEIKLAHEPETFFACAYLRAQAYWGLAQKHVAIEILETILNTRPHYRSSSALLDVWRSQ